MDNRMNTRVMNQTPCIGISKAGHDKGRVYLVLKLQDGFAEAADGVHAHYDKAKRKNLRHIQLIHEIPGEVQSLLKEPISDSKIIYILKVYRRYRATSHAPNRGELHMYKRETACPKLM